MKAARKKAIEFLNLNCNSFEEYPSGEDYIAFFGVTENSLVTLSVVVRREKE